MTRFSATAIRRYYDRHTPVFLRYGRGRSTGAIHRAVWGPDVTSRTAAFRYVEARIVDHLRSTALDHEATHVVDLGCGVGSSLVYLAERLPIRGTGVTLSPVQAAMAEARIRQAGLSHRLRCLAGDFTDLPPSIPAADLAYAIEAFVHGPSAETFFDQCRRLVRSGGWLIICDDVQRPVTGALARDTIDRFCRGWHINTLLDASELAARAREAGFVREAVHDLTAFVELGRPRDRILAPIARLLRLVPPLAAHYGHLVGGDALQRCLRAGWIGYDLTVFRRQD